jgi:hypothetical protein
VILLRTPDDLDDQVRDWLTEAFAHASDDDEDEGTR